MLHTLRWAKIMKTPLPNPLPIAVRRGEGALQPATVAGSVTVLADGQRDAALNDPDHVI
jgi:hypothetical protein